MVVLAAHDVLLFHIRFRIEHCLLKSFRFAFVHLTHHFAAVVQLLAAHVVLAQFAHFPLLLRFDNFQFLADILEFLVLCSARFLLAIKEDSFSPLFDFIKDETIDSYLRIAACIEIYKQYIEEEYTCTDDEKSAKDALIIANELGAHFDINNLFCDYEEVESYDYEVEVVEHDDDDNSDDVYEPYCLYESTYPESDNGGYNYGWGGEDGITSDDGPDDLYDYFYNDDYDGWDYDDY